MADNYSQATVWPELPAALFNEDELRLLERACGLTCQRNGEMLYFFAESCFNEQGDDPDGLDVNCLALLQEKLRQLDPAEYPSISINGACTCSKMRPDEFAGFAYFITRDGIRSTSTWEWLDNQKRANAIQPAQTA